MQTIILIFAIIAIINLATRPQEPRPAPRLIEWMPRKK